jgi:hypothetical protein
MILPVVVGDSPFVEPVGFDIVGVRWFVFPPRLEVRRWSAWPWLRRRKIF